MKNEKKPKTLKRICISIRQISLLMLLFLFITNNAIIKANDTVNDHFGVSQTGKVSGIVKDEYGTPLIGVGVIVKGTKIGTVTDMDGRFTIEAPKGSKLIITYIGMDPIEVEVTGSDFPDIILKEKAMMDEVVVIGYGTVKKSNLSGAVSTVSSKDLQKMPSTNLSQALQGNVPGMHTLQSDRNPGAEVSITLRGKNSFSGGEPLFIVDGFPIASGGGANSINPNDIESVSVLKDASSTAIYGARAANGVILITTKLGKLGKPKLEVTSSWGISNFNNPIKMMNAQQFMALREESFKNDTQTMPNLLDTEKELLDNGQSTNWYDEVTGKNRLTQDYQISYSSGTETTKIHVGAGILSQEGIVNNTNFIRGNLRINVSQKFGDRVTLSTFNNISLISKRGTDPTSVLFPALVGSPMAPIKDNNGIFYPMLRNSLGTPKQNPAAFSELQNIKEIEPLINPSMSLDVKIIDGLKVKTQASGEIDNYRKNFYNPKLISASDEINGPRVSEGYAYITSSVNYNWMSETTLMYNKTFNKIHNIDALAGFSVQQNRWETVTASASGFGSDAYESYNLGAGAGTPRKPSSDLIEWNMLSYLGRIVYTLKDKYIFTVNIRADGSSRFAKNNKWGYFPSFAGAWRMGQENFLQEVEWLSDLKLRGSYGFSGNADALKPYTTLARLEKTNYNFNGVEALAYYEGNMPSNNMKWENTKQIDLGVDFALFNNRLNFVFDYYYKKTEGMIRQIPIPATTGFPMVWANMGDLQNKGIELAVNSVNLDGAFVWKTNFMISSNRNKVTSFSDGSNKIGTEHFLGMPVGIGNRYMVLADGIWQQNEKEEAAKYKAQPGDVKYIDQNGDYEIDDKDRVFAGSYYSRYYGSLTNSFEYKNLDLNIFITFDQGRDVYNGNNYILLSGSTGDNNRVEMLDRWTVENPSNKYPRASSKNENRKSIRSSEFLEDASYIKVRNISLGYTFPHKITRKFGITNLRAYGSVTNPFTFTKYTGMDPEDGDYNNNDRKSSYPINTTYTFGLQLNF